MYSPKWIKGLTVSADWWHIDMRDIVSTLGAQEIIQTTRPPNGASTILNPNGSEVVRSAGTDPTGEPGPVTLVLDPNQNISGAIFEGLDYEAIYILDSTIFGHGDWGRLTTTINGTWLSRAELQPSSRSEAFRYRWRVLVHVIHTDQFAAEKSGQFQYLLRWPG